MTNKIELVTIGAYGFDEAGFFQALQAAGVDTFLDLRQRRGVRGARYAFANHRRLQSRLEALGIRYLHFKALAPPPELRQLQKTADQAQGTQKRARSGLSPAFIQAYQEQVLETLDPQEFIDRLPEDCRTAALFCVESLPAACHRSLAARWFAQRCGCPVKDILPWKS